jgi:hypothetical protein
MHTTRPRRRREIMWCPQEFRENVAEPHIFFTVYALSHHTVVLIQDTCTCKMYVRYSRFHSAIHQKYINICRGRVVSSVYATSTHPTSERDPSDQTVRRANREYAGEVSVPVHGQAVRQLVAAPAASSFVGPRLDQCAVTRCAPHVRTRLFRRLAERFR